MFSRTAALSCCLALAALVGGCGPDEDYDPCADYCAAAGECAKLSQQLFSHSECRRTCADAMERHVSVDCGTRFADWLECKANLYCGNWNNDSQYCAQEIDYLDYCLGGNS